MGYKYSVLVLVSWMAVASCYDGDKDLGVCTDLSCAPRHILLEQIRLLQDRIHEEPVLSKSERHSSRPAFLSVTNPTTKFAETCSCLPNPCQNGGRCEVDTHSPVDKYTCKCPENTYGTNCENVLVCNETSCARNADCKVLNHEMTCTCKTGLSGDPTKPDGCQHTTVEACMTGDPHYKTFDGLAYNYQGTCPYIFSEPCNGLAGGYDNFTVKARNQKWSAVASTVRETEIVMFGNTIYIDEYTKRVTFNGAVVTAPHTWRGDDGKEISITYEGGAFYVKNLKDSVTVIFAHFSLCIRIPDVPEFSGNCTLCGLAGNWDGNYQNDIATSRNCTFFNATRRVMGDDQNLTAAVDIWKVVEFNSTTDIGDCKNGTEMANATCADEKKALAIQKCRPIVEVNSGAGPFAACAQLGNDIIQQSYQDCIFDVCANSDMCQIFTTFAHLCMSYLPNTNLGEWRAKLGCELTCPANSIYSSCKSTCPATCVEPNKPTMCTMGCTEGCECDAGYVLDTSQLERTTCVRREQCGCTDECGRVHAEKSSWLSDSCNTMHTCIGGKHASKFYPCNTNAECQMIDTEQQCVCKKGCVGDGYSCTCANTGTCAQPPNPGSVPIQQGCEDGWTVFDNECFLFVNDLKTYDAAKGNCASLGAELTTIHTQTKNDFLSGLYMRLRNAVGYPDAAWIGSRRQSPTDNFTQWEDGTAMDFTQWGMNLPDNHIGQNENCVEHSYHPDYSIHWFWNDRNCEQPNRSICQKKL